MFRGDSWVKFGSHVCCEKTSRFSPRCQATTESASWLRAKIKKHKSFDTMAAATTAATAATNATAGLRRTAVPRAPPELSSYKTRFNAYLQHIGLPFVDDLTPEDVASPGDIESIMCSWAEYMSTNPPRYMNNRDKLLNADGVGNGFGLIKEYLKDRFGRHVDWTDETWFTLSKGALVKKLERDSVRGTSGVDEVPGKIGIVRLNPDAGVIEGHDGVSTSPFADDVPDMVTINRKLLKTSKLGDKHQRRLALNLTYAADGRSGEVKYLNYQGMTYDPVGNCAAADWKDLKNGRFLPGGWVDILPTRPTHGGGCHPPDTHRYRRVDGWLDGCENCLISRPNLHNFAQQPPRTMPKSSKSGWPPRAQVPTMVNF